MQTDWSERHERVFYEIRSVLEEERLSKIPITPSLRVDTALKSTGEWEEDDFDNLVCLLESRLGFRGPTEEWGQFCGAGLSGADWEDFAKEHFRFEDLTSFVVDWLDRVRIEPKRVLGKECLPAGAFHALVDVVSEIKPGVKRFGPSMLIKKRLREQELDHVWRRLAWFGETPPPLRRTLVTKTANISIWAFVISLVAVVSGIAMMDFGPTEVVGLLLFVLGLYCVLPSLILAALLSRIDDRLPEGFRTFRDLAVFLGRSAGDPGANPDVGWAAPTATSRAGFARRPTYREPHADARGNHD